MHSIYSLIIRIASLLLCRPGLLLLPGPAWLGALTCDVTEPLTIVALKPLPTRLGARVCGTDIHWRAVSQSEVLGRFYNPNTTPKDKERVVVCLRGTGQELH